VDFSNYEQEDPDHPNEEEFHRPRDRTPRRGAAQAEWDRGADGPEQSPWTGPWRTWRRPAVL